MKDAQTLQDKIFAQHLSDSQNTHDIAAQATAARLLCLLEARYIWIGSGEPDNASQQQLQDYILQMQAWLDNEAIAPGMIQVNGQDHPVACLITHMLSLDFELSDKKNLLARLEMLVNKHPNGDTWKLSDAQWAINKMYNSQDDTTVQVSSSPAKTLSLVCAAILDGAHHDDESTEDPSLPSSSSFVQARTQSQENERVRRMARAMAECLLRLHGAERGKCSGGQQHDLLWLLQGSYLDEERRLFEFVESLPAFLTNLVTSFIQKELLPRASEEERIALVNEWMKYSTTLEAMENPLLSMLQHYLGESWPDACSQWMKASCARVGINPETQLVTILSMTNSLAELSIPIQNNPHAQLVMELYRTTEINCCTAAMRGLVDARNVAMQRFKKAVLDGNWDELQKKHAGIADLYTAESRFQSLLRYAGMTLIGAGDNTMLEAGQPMMAALLDYFIHYEIDIRLPSGFEQINAEYGIHEKQFKEQSHEGVITTFFQEMKTNPDSFEPFWTRIQAIPGLQLSDESIQKILSQHFSEAYITFQEGLPSTLTQVTELSTYDINRLLLHGLHLGSKRWSDIYKQTIASVCKWLLSPKSDEDSLAMSAVKQGYPDNFLANVFLQAVLTDELKMLLLDQQDMSELLLYNTLLTGLRRSSVVQRKQLFGLITPYFSLLIQTGNQLHHLFSLCLEQFDTEQRIMVWGAIKANLPSIVENGYQLAIMFSFGLDQFSDDQRIELWDAFKNNLPSIIQDGDQLVGLFKLRLNQFNARQRTTLWDAFKNNLPSIIQDGDQLVGLFALDIEKLNPAQRIELWDTFKNDLPSIVHNGTHLANLLALGLKKFNAEQRNVLWEALKNKLPALIQNGIHLRDLLALDFTEFTAEQRTALWNSLKDNLGTIIKSDAELLKVFELGLDKLNEEQRMSLWHAINGNLVSIIRDGFQLRYLFALCFKQFNVVQRNELWNVIKNNLSSTIKTGYEFRGLFTLGLDRFTAEQRTVLWDAFKNDLATIIKDGTQFGELFALSLDQFTAAQRTVLWNTFKNDLATIIKSGYQFEALFALDLDRFTAEQRAMLWDTIKNNLSTIINNDIQFLALFALDLNRFTAEQRIELWNTIKNNLSSIIKTDTQFRTLFLLGLDQFNQEQRGALWDIFKNDPAVIIKKGTHLRDLLMLDFEQFNSDQRTMLWDAIKENLSGIIRNTCELVQLLKLGVDKLNNDQRDQIYIGLKKGKCPVSKLRSIYAVYSSETLERVSVVKQGFFSDSQAACSTSESRGLSPTNR